MPASIAVTDASSPEVAVLCARWIGAASRTLTLNRPEKGNRYNQAMLDTLLGGDRRVSGPIRRCASIVLRGGRQAFLRRRGDRGRSSRRRRTRRAPPFLAFASRSTRSPKPTIALVHGACIGGGVALVSCCDIVIAARDAFFSLPEVRLGFAPGPLIPFFLRAIEPRSLRRYLLSGERFAAEAAMRIGLVHELYDADGGDAALAALIDELLLAGPNAVAQRQGAAAPAGASRRSRRSCWRSCSTNSTPPSFAGSGSKASPAFARSASRGGLRRSTTQ